MGRLSSQTAPGGSAQAITYDANSNRTRVGSVTATFDQANRILTRTDAGAGGPAVVASDGFERVVSAGLGSADSGGSYTLTGSSGDYSVSGGAGHISIVASSSRTATLGSPSARDVDVSVDFSADKKPVGGSGGLRFEVLARRVGSSHYSFQVYVQPTKTTVLLKRSVSGTETTLKSVQLGSYVYAPGDVIHLQLKVAGSGTSTIEGTAWVNSDPKPGTPQVSTTDTTASLQVPGGVGVWTYLSAGVTNAPIKVNLDNLSAADASASGPVTTSFQWSSRGTLDTAVSGAVTKIYAFDAFANMTSDGSSSFTFDSLGREYSNGSNRFSYAGTSIAPVGVGIQVFARSGDSLLASKVGAAAPLVAVNDVLHMDLVGQLPAAGVTGATPWSGAAAYDAYGRPAAPSTIQGAAGYQGDWTDPSSGVVHMGERNYDPAVGQFLSRDRLAVGASGLAGANRFTYAGGNPVSGVDPTGTFRDPDSIAPVVVAAGGSAPVIAAAAPFVAAAVVGFAVGFGLGYAVGKVHKGLQELHRTNQYIDQLKANLARNVRSIVSSIKSDIASARDSVIQGKIRAARGKAPFAGLSTDELYCVVYPSHPICSGGGAPAGQNGRPRGPRGPRPGWPGSPRCAACSGDPSRDLPSPPKLQTPAPPPGTPAHIIPVIEVAWGATTPLGSTTAIAAASTEPDGAAAADALGDTAIDALPATGVSEAALDVGAVDLSAPSGIEQGGSGVGEHDSDTPLLESSPGFTVVPGQSRAEAEDHCASQLPAGQTNRAYQECVHANTLAPRTAAARAIDAITGAGSGAGANPAGAVLKRPVYPPNRGFEFDPVETTLQPGSSIDRYGARGGTFASPEGTPYGQRALPGSPASKPYEAYEVLKAIEGVQVGTVRPWFDQPGKGIQYELPRSIQELIDDGFLGVKK